MDGDRYTISFPDGPRGELDRAVLDLLDRAQNVLHAQGRLRALLRASTTVSAEIDLNGVLQRIVDAAAELADAQYCALGVISPSGGLEAFIHTGMPDELVARIGRLPEGHGLLGAVIAEAQSLRLDDLATDHRSSGFPPHHPDMKSFLGVPIRVGESVYGNLYLTNRRGGPFTDEDEELISALAAAAGNAIRNARLYRETHWREGWMRLSARLSTSLLSAADDDALALITNELVTGPETDQVGILVPGADPLTLRVAAITGPRERDLRQAILPAASTAGGMVLESGESRLVVGGRYTGAPDPLTITAGDEAGAALFAPFTTRDRTWGVLVIGRGPHARQFSDTERIIVTDVASRLSLVLELVRAREAEQRGILLEDRARIARDLHDHVIQLLFATGLDLHQLDARSDDQAETDLIQRSISRLDDSIAKIRTIVFSINPPAANDAPTARHALIDIATEASKMLPRPVDVAFSGPVDVIITDSLLNDVAATARELLSNVVRHSEATVVDLLVTVSDDDVSVTVRDDGVGFDTSQLSGGTKNLSQRARLRGGDLTLSSTPGFTAVHWSVPIPAQSDSLA